jgi:riboflavin kinase / FMN adenylyltransferase
MKTDELDELVVRLARAQKPAIVTMGTFDGVHRGHQALIAQARRHARVCGLPLVAVTFSPRPEQLFKPDTALPDICSLATRIRRLRAAGADDVVVIPFNRRIAGIRYEMFAALLVEHLGMRALFVGADFALGRGREGTPRRLQALGIDVRTQRLLLNASRTEKLSSSGIRLAIAAGASARQALAAA